MPHARFQPASDQSLLVYFDSSEEKSGAPGPVRAKSAAPSQNQITLEGHEQVRRLLRLVELEPIAGVRNLHPAYCSLLVKFDAVKLRHEELNRSFARLCRPDEKNGVARAAAG